MPWPPLGSAGSLRRRALGSTLVETHVILSLLHQTPLYVITTHEESRRVSDGAIAKIGNAN